MTDLKQYHDKLMSFTNQTMTTQELINLGITKHFISKLVKKGKLERVKRGTYLVKSLNKGKNRSQYVSYQYFMESVSLENFEMAYKHLLKSYNRSAEKDNNNNFIICFTLLRDILGSRYNVNPLLELGDLKLDKRNTYWNNFCKCVHDRRYEEALKYLEKYIKKQQIKNNEVSQTVLTMQTLLQKVISLKVDKASISEETTPKVNICESRHHFKNFLKVFNLDNLEESIKELSLSVAYGNPEDENYAYNKCLLNMLNKLVKMRKDGDILEEKNIDYNLRDLPINNFNRAIELEDYKKANAFMHLINLPNSITFEIRKKILGEMVRLDKANRNTFVKKDEEPKKDNVIVEEKQENLAPKMENNEVQSKVIKPKIEIDESIKEEAQEIDLTYDNIYNLIYNRQYDLALAVVNREDKGELDRLCNMTSRLILRIKELLSGKLNSCRHKSEITGNKLKDFYRALNYLDYETAYELADDLANTLRDPGEFEIYKLILEDLKKLRQDVENAVEEISSLGTDLSEISKKQALNREDIVQLVAILERRIELERFVSRPNDRDLSLLDIAAVTILSLDGKLNIDSFEIFDYDEKPRNQIFTLAINQGDYLTAGRIIKSIDWNELGGQYSFTFVKLCDSLLRIMIAHLPSVKDATAIKDAIAKEKITKAVADKIKSLAQELPVYGKEEAQEKWLFLEKIYRMVKERHYEEVFNMIIESDLSFNYKEDPYILGALAVKKASIDHQANDLYDKYIESLESCSQEESQKYLAEYREFLVQNFMEDTKTCPQKNLSPQD